MPQVQILRGGAPVKNTILVNVDNETVLGDGSIEDPLRAPGGAGAITTEHVEITAGTGAVDPAKTVSFVAYTGLIPEDPSSEIVTLADGTTDGQQKEILLGSANNIQWRITPDNFANSPGSFIQFTTGGTGGALLTWDATAGNWALVSAFNGTVI